MRSTCAAIARFSRSGLGLDVFRMDGDPAVIWEGLRRGGPIEGLRDDPSGPPLCSVGYCYPRKVVGRESTGCKACLAEIAENSGLVLRGDRRA